MAGFQNLKMSYYIILGMVFHAFIGASSAGFHCTENIKATCGSPADIECRADTNIIDATLRRCKPDATYCANIENKKTSEPLVNFTHTASGDGRITLSFTRNTTKVSFNPARLSDSGAYSLYLRPNGTGGGDTHNRLTITGPPEPPKINLTWPCKTKIVCEAVGGCPLGQIQWSDRHGTNLTMNAIPGENGGRLNSTLNLNKSSTMKEYCCTVTYRRMDKTEANRSCTTRPQLITECQQLTAQVNPENVSYALYVLVAITLLLIAIVVLVIYLRRFRRHQDAETAGDPSERHPFKSLQNT